MASKSQKVASALNRMTKHSFVDALSHDDRVRMSDFIADFFCKDSQSDKEEEPGKWLLL